MKNYRVHDAAGHGFVRARAFYKEKLGLTPTEPDGDVFE